ncbi:EAL domain-containing protein [Candidatus Sumerlaeota bacterium]|nr:EAL domain-containing protein [Candidatus Sumerlaeota bacterium]
MSDDLLFDIGYSSLGIVQRLPIDMLKLDCSFVETDSGVGCLQRDLLKALVRVITTHEISVICEGVETKEQEEFLREI